MPDYIPDPDAEFEEWFATFLAYCVAHKVKLGLSDADLLEIQVAKATWSVAYTQHLAAQNAAQGAKTHSRVTTYEAYVIMPIVIFYQYFTNHFKILPILTLYLIPAVLYNTHCEPLSSLLSQVGRYTDKVTHWKNSSQKQRWVASALLWIEPRLRRIKGYRHLPKLRAVLLAQAGDIQQVAA